MHGEEEGTREDSKDHTATSATDVCMLADHPATSYQEVGPEGREGGEGKEGGKKRKREGKREREREKVMRKEKREEGGRMKGKTSLG